MLFTNCSAAWASSVLAAGSLDRMRSIMKASTFRDNATTAAMAMIATCVYRLYQPETCSIPSSYQHSMFFRSLSRLFSEALARRTSVRFRSPGGRASMAAWISAGVRG